MYVKRTRIRNSPRLVATGQNQIGKIAYSSNYATVPAAEQYVTEWERTGEWACEIIGGRRPPDS